MMVSFKAKRGTIFFFDPDLAGDIWITAEHTITIPAEDLLEFSATAAGTRLEGVEEETDELMRILDRCGVFDPKQSREESRRKLAKRMRGGYDG
jgi:hypothetical protein